MKKLIIFLVRKRLGLKKGEHFKFANQADKWNTYYFMDDCLMKHVPNLGWERKSNVSLNWLLNDECEIVKANEKEKEE